MSEYWEIIGGIIIGFCVIALICFILQIIGYWKMFEKAGEAGWKSLIPIYNEYTAYKIAWKEKYFWAVIILGGASSIIGSLSINHESGVMLLLSAIISILLMVLEIMFCVNLSKHFGYGTGFAVGLIFLPFIFTLIIAFGNHEYISEVDTTDISFIENL